ncbi:MAG: wax ester/triacylglycerol synthase family O-acyltransferase, partial [Xanthomonadales bacterium]|nr:wax ester/triacylglycerol synthase family O-acyltransferase [Xanthomonadales bacterium]NIT33260.1 wax ester/triacylglycerol synthase family O-acyltransferase [Xanthomonadales bacterium]
LPRPGTDEQLKQVAGRIISIPLDRSKPLWELWVVEGLEGGRFAVITKIHHCMIDGIAGVDLMAVLLGAEPALEIEA